MGEVLFFSLTAALNPTLIAVVTIILLLPRPQRLLLGYLLGAMLTSITLGLVIVFSLESSGATSTAKNTVNPAADLAVGLIALVVAFVLHGGSDERLRERRRERKEAKGSKEKGTPRWQRFLGRGSARATFLVGVALTLPGASYLAGLHRIAEQNLSNPETVLVVIGFNLIMLIAIELPLLGFALAPEWTPKAVERFKAWLSRRGRTIAIRGLTAFGVLLIVRAAITVLAS